jgi:hypothetical protein
MNMKVPQTTLLGNCTLFKGLTLVEDGVYYIKLARSPLILPENGVAA